MTFIGWNELTPSTAFFALASCWKSKIYIIWCLQKVLCVGDNKWRPSVAVFVLKCVSWRPPGSPPPVWRVASGLPTSVPRAGCSELGVARRTLIVLTSANYSLELAPSTWTYVFSSTCRRMSQWWFSGSAGDKERRKEEVGAS